MAIVLEATAALVGELNIIAQPKTAAKLAASRTDHSSSGCQAGTGTSCGATPAKVATTQTPIAIASNTTAA